MFLGAAVYAWAFGTMTSIISSMNTTEAKYQEKMEQVNTFLKELHLPPKLKARVKGYYDYKWLRHRTFETNTVMEELPVSLSSDIATYNHKKMLQKSPLFATFQPGFLQLISMCFQPQIALPKECLFGYGDESDKMYFMNKGVVDIVSKEGTKICAVTDGGYFGDVGFFCGREFSFKNPLEEKDEGHNVFARTASFCDLFWISCDDLAYILEDLYGEYGVVFSQIAEARWKFVSSDIPYEDDGLLKDHIKGLKKSAYPSKYDSMQQIMRPTSKNFLRVVKSFFSYGVQSPQLSSAKRSISSRMEESLRMEDTELITNDGFSEALEALGQDKDAAGNKRSAQRSALIKQLGTTVQVHAAESAKQPAEPTKVVAQTRAAIRRMSASGDDMEEFYAAMAKKKEEPPPPLEATAASGRWKKLSSIVTQPSNRVSAKSNKVKSVKVRCNSNITMLCQCPKCRRFYI
jgi:hypothetical protein